MKPMRDCPTACPFWSPLVTLVRIDRPEHGNPEIFMSSKPKDKAELLCTPVCYDDFIWLVAWTGQKRTDVFTLPVYLWRVLREKGA